MAISWVLKDVTGGTLATPVGSPLLLQFDENGYAFFAGAGEPVHTATAISDTATVTIELRPDEKADSEGVTLSKALSSPSPDSGFTWTNVAGGLTTLVFTAPPENSEDVYEWVFGEPQPPVALKMKVRLRR